MQRTVSSALAVRVHQPARLSLLVSVADAPGLRLDEELRVTVDGHAVSCRELKAEHGTRLHLVDAPVGLVEISYDATVDGRAEPAPGTDLEQLTYLRPSRYAESDRLAVVARAEFGDLRGVDLLRNVTSWVAGHLKYVTGTSRVFDGAVDTLLAGQGVCRDFAHLTLGLLRARDVPARMVAVYAPGLKPMDFHAVVEAYVDDAWHVADATGLAPRESLLRIATGHDAADTAFLSAYGGQLELVDLRVSAVVAGDLPKDDQSGLSVLG